MLGNLHKVAQLVREDGIRTQAPLASEPWALTGTALDCYTGHLPPSSASGVFAPSFLQRTPPASVRTPLLAGTHVLPREVVLQ